jgi:hypothetical protein
MNVFIAGATIAGLVFVLKSQHLNIDVTRLSHNPCDNLPIVFADRGAINIAYAIFLSSICSTASSLYVQDVHSSESLNNRSRGFDRSVSEVIS